MSFSAGEVFIFVDVETTGLDSRHDEIIEIAAVRGSAYDPNWTTFASLVKPSRRLPSVITAITGLKDADLEYAGPIAQVLPRFFDFVGHGTLRSYNAPFDRGFINSAAKAANLRLPNRFECVLELTRNTYPHFGSYKLDRVCTELKIERHVSHRALDDAIAAMQVFFKCHGTTMSSGASPLR